MRKNGGFLGVLGGQMILKLEDKCEAKINCDLVKIQFALFMIRVNKHSGDAYL